MARSYRREDDPHPGVYANRYQRIPDPAQPPPPEYAIQLKFIRHDGQLWFGWWEAWMLRGTCNAYPSQWWFLQDRDGAAVLETDNYSAMEICRRRCPVRQVCLRRAIETKAEGVIRGGVPMVTPVECSVCAICQRQFIRPRRVGGNPSRRNCYRCNPNGRQARDGVLTKPSRRDRCRPSNLTPLAVAAIIADPL